MNKPPMDDHMLEVFLPIYQAKAWQEEDDAVFADEYSREDMYYQEYRNEIPLEDLPF